MTKRTLLVLIITLLALTSTQLFAHDEFRVVGTISKVEKTHLQVKTTEGKTYNIGMDSQTLISRDKNKVDATELKPGRSVVVDAIGDSELDLLALEVRLVPAITK
jgi:hypothetical protein